MIKSIGPDKLKDEWLSGKNKHMLYYYEKHSNGGSGWFVRMLEPGLYCFNPINYCGCGCTNSPFNVLEGIEPIPMSIGQIIAIMIQYIENPPIVSVPVKKEHLEEVIKYFENKLN